VFFVALLLWLRLHPSVDLCGPLWFIPIFCARFRPNSFSGMLLTCHIFLLFPVLSAIALAAEDRGPCPRPPSFLCIHKTFPFRVF